MRKQRRQYSTEFKLETVIEGIRGEKTVAQNDYEQTRRYYEQSLRLRRETGDRRGVADSLDDLAEVATLAGDDTKAKRLAEESRAIRQEIGE